ncbi:hypothetical protein I6A84_40040, partial [Frankia sp. CNm7]|uniref:FtsX-like permease family protein n=1 Tax=Frankia nepalensis TaxID=1836974 RepID=UPI0019348714
GSPRPRRPPPPPPPPPTAALAAPIVAISAIAGSLLVTLSFTADWTVAQDRAQLAAPLVVEPGGPAAARAVAADPTVAVVDARRHLTGEAPAGEHDGDALEGEDVDVVDVRAAAAARGLRAVRGNLADLRGETIAVTETLVTDLGLEPGDTVRGRLAGRDVALRVVAVVPDAPDLYGERLIPADLFTGGLAGLEPDLLFVIPRAGVSADAARASLEGALAGTGSRVLSAEAWIDEVDAATRAANNVGIVVLLGPAGVYAAIAIVNATLIGAAQRRRQHDLVRLLGATEGQQRRLAVWTAGLVGTAALLIGAFTTGFLGWLIRQATARDLARAHPEAHVSVAMSIPWLPLLAVAATCAALAIAAALAGTLPTRRRGQP